MPVKHSQGAVLEQIEGSEVDDEGQSADQAELNEFRHPGDNAALEGRGGGPGAGERDEGRFGCVRDMRTGLSHTIDNRLRGPAVR